MINTQLQDKVAVVTGGARGMGERICRELAEAGATVAVLDRDETGAAEVARTLDRGVSYFVDLADSKNVKEVIARLQKDDLAPDVLVCAAGWSVVTRFLDSDDSLWDALIAVNYRSQVQLTYAFLPHMRAAGWGRLIYIGSDAGRVGSSGEAIYSGCKAALGGFAKSIAREHARDGVTSNVVSPGPTDTPMLQAAAIESPKRIEALKRAIPVGRFGTPADIAAAVAFLVSDSASYITGQILSISGGLTMS